MPNDSRLPDGRRDAARQLAEELAADGLRTARLAESLAVKTQPSEDFEQALEAVEAAAAPQGERCRVAFFGESAAAGYLYAPEWTPAKALAEYLGGGVVDLSRTNETLAGFLRQLVAAPPAEIFVVFIGNNWELLETPEISPYAPSTEARMRFAGLLRGDSWNGAARHAAQTLAVKVRRTLDALARFATRYGSQVVLVIPEVNEEWAVLQPDVLRPLARQLPGPVEPDEESYHKMALLGSPRLTVAGRRLLNEAAKRHEWRSVDLREVFVQHKLRDNEAFLDYCHLTSEGMRVAMKAVALAIQGEAGIANLAPAPTLEALAYLGAAVHTAHRHPPTEGKKELIVRRLQEAVAADPDVVDAFWDLVEARSTPLPAFLTAAQPRNLASPFRLGFQHGWRWDFVDADLVQAIGVVLAENGDPEAPAKIATRFARFLAVGETGRELAQAPFLWDPLERFYPEAMAFADLDERATLRSPLPWIRFCLVVAKPAEVLLKLTLRRPLPADDSVVLKINGESVAELPACPTWQREQVRLPAATVREGLNELEIRWPEIAGEALDGAYATAVEDLALGRETEMHPVYGEVAAITATVAADEG